MFEDEMMTAQVVPLLAAVNLSELHKEKLRQLSFDSLYNLVSSYIDAVLNPRQARVKLT
jgi:hypothetical protein